MLRLVTVPCTMRLDQLLYQISEFFAHFRVARSETLEFSKIFCFCWQDCGVQLTDEADKRCYPLDNHLFCHGCHIQRLQTQFPDEHFFYDPVTKNIQNTVTKDGKQRNSIAITPASLESYPQNLPPSLSHPQTMSKSDSPSSSVPASPAIMNGGSYNYSGRYDGYRPQPGPQVPSLKPGATRYQVTDL